MSPYRERYHRELEELKMDAEKLVDQVDLAVVEIEFEAHLGMLRHEFLDQRGQVQQAE